MGSTDCPGLLDTRSVAQDLSELIYLLPGSSGVGRTGAFCLLYAAMQEVEAGNSIPDLVQLVKRIRQQRKHMLQEKVRRWADPALE